MPGVILKTKLYIPPVRAGQVSRPRLIDHLNAGQDCRLTLISAPAGFGKTSLLVEWIARSESPCARISLDEKDNDPRRFLTYFIAALQEINPSTGRNTLASLRAAQTSFPDTLLTSLVNEIAEIPIPFTLVLDDYHTISEKCIQDFLSSILEHPPEPIHLVISGRADPPWPLARLRARGEVNELRSSDLRFTPSEAAIFLDQTMEKYMLQITNAIGVIVADAYLASCILIFVFRLLGKAYYGHLIGYLQMALVLPLGYLLMQAAELRRPPMYYLQISLLLLFILAETLLDYVIKVDFRNVKWAVICYVVLFFGATGGMLGVAAHSGPVWSISAAILFLAMAALAFAQRAVTGL